MAETHEGSAPPLPCSRSSLQTVWETCLGTASPVEAERPVTCFP